MIDLAALLTWLDQQTPFIAKYAPDALASLRADRDRLAALTSRPDHVTVCVLGNSAVGKSTLLNALVAEHRVILPAGGTGPLTASATVVRHSPSPFLNVTYHSRQVLDGVRLALENELRRRGGSDAQAAEADAAGLEPVDDLLPDEREVEERLLAERLAARIKEAAQIVCGDQYANVPLQTLVSGMRHVLGQDAAKLPVLEEADRARCERAATALASGAGGRPVHHAGAVGDPAMLAVLRAHAAGSLAPLVKTIEVGWPSGLLAEGLVLVDLPGIGVAGDRYREITARYVRDEARGVVLVVDKSGPNESAVELLRASGYWERLLLAAGDPEGDRCALLLAVTKLDDEARVLRQQSLQDPKPALRDVFHAVREEAVPRMRAQAAASLGELSDATAGQGTMREAADAAGRLVLATLAVLPVAAPQYAYLWGDDEEQRPFVRDAEETGVPELGRALTALAREHRMSLSAACHAVADRLLRGMSGALDQIEARWSAGARAAEEAAQLRAALDTFLGPLRIRLADSRGVYRGFLEDAAATRVAELVEKAGGEAELAMMRYLARLRGLNWATLRAAVVRGGIYVHGRRGPVDVPRDLAMLFQEPMAAIWGKTLLQVIRKRTRDHARDVRELVTEICDWADEEAGTRVRRQVLAGQIEQAEDREKRLAEVGAEAIADLKNAVLVQLEREIARPIKAACEKFVAEGRHVGTGTASRIHALLDSLAADATRRARVPAERLLRQRFEAVRADIHRELESWGDPLEAAVEAVVGREEARRARSDAQQRAGVLAEVARARASLPNGTDLRSDRRCS